MFTASDTSEQCNENSSNLHFTVEQLKTFFLTYFIVNSKYRFFICFCHLGMSFVSGFLRYLTL